MIDRGEGKFQIRAVEALETDAGYEDMGGLWFDADGNGFADLYVVSGSYEFERGDPELADRLYLNDGSSLSRFSRKNLDQSG